MAHLKEWISHTSQEVQRGIAGTIKQKADAHDQMFDRTHNDTLHAQTAAHARRMLAKGVYEKQKEKRMDDLQFQKERAQTRHEELTCAIDGERLRADQMLRAADSAADLYNRQMIATINAQRNKIQNEEAQLKLKRDYETVQIFDLDEDPNSWRKDWKNHQNCIKFDEICAQIVIFVSSGSTYGQYSIWAGDITRKDHAPEEGKKSVLKTKSGRGILIAEELGDGSASVLPPIIDVEAEQEARDRQFAEQVQRNITNQW
jgi:hypothetical protein